MTLIFTVKTIVSKVVVVLFELGLGVLRNYVIWKLFDTKYTRNFEDFTLRFQLPFSSFDKLFFLGEFTVELLAETVKLVFDNKSVFLYRVTN